MRNQIRIVHIYSSSGEGMHEFGGLQRIINITCAQTIYMEAGLEKDLYSGEGSSEGMHEPFLERGQ